MLTQKWLALLRIQNSQSQIHRLNHPLPRQHRSHHLQPHRYCCLRPCFVFLVELAIFLSDGEGNLCRRPTLMFEDLFIFNKKYLGICNQRTKLFYINHNRICKYFSTKDQFISMLTIRFFFFFFVLNSTYHI